jgi:hypothetical protein
MRTKGLTETCSRVFAKPAMMLGENLADYEAMRDLVLADMIRMMRKSAFSHGMSWIPNGSSCASAA